MRGAIVSENGIISLVSRETLAGFPAADTIDGNGMIVSPGFIDAHGHSDIALMASKDGFSKSSQGITTEISGNCGLSPFPITEKNRSHLEDLYASYNIELAWQSVEEYQNKLFSLDPAIDLVPLAGHNTLRAAAAGYECKSLSEKDSSAMNEMLSEMLARGTRGLSFGLLYVPGKFADADEVISLMKTLSKADAVCTVHLRSEGASLIESLDEMIDYALAAGLKKLHLSHFKTAQKNNWHKLDTALEHIAEAQKNGICITIDRYPYVESMTQLSAVIPAPWIDIDDSSLQRLLARSDEKAKLYAALMHFKDEEYWQRVILANTNAAKYSDKCGCSFASFSSDPAAAAVELLAADANGTTVAASSMSEENMRRIINLDCCMMGSDGFALPADNKNGHPRSFGSAAKFMRLLLDGNTNIEKAVYKMTGLPAKTFSLYDRGTIAAGKRSDLVIFNPDEIDSAADFRSPNTPADGILCTISAGRITWRNR
jgi:N-acyl-D-amino-acid deacylase